MKSIKIGSNKIAIITPTGRVVVVARTLRAAWG